MPLVKLNELAYAGAQRPLGAADEHPDPPSWGNIFSSSWAEGDIGSTINDLNSQIDVARMPAQPGYSPTREDMTGYEDQAAFLYSADSPSQLAAMKARLDREQYQRRVLAEGGWASVGAGLVTGLVDPINLIPIGLEYGAAKDVATSFLRTTARLGAENLGAAAVQENVLQNTQPTRGLDEAIANVTFQTLFGAALGAGTHILSSEGAAALSESLGRDLAWARSGGATNVEGGVAAATPSGEIPAPIGGGASGGAAAVDPRTMAELEIAPATVGVEGTRAGVDITPLVTGKRTGLGAVVGSQAARLVSYQSLALRKAALKLVDPILRIAGNKAGIVGAVGGPVETRMKFWRGNLVPALTEGDRQFVKLRFGREQKFGDITRAGLQDVRRDVTAAMVPGEPPTRQQFNREVSIAIQEGKHDSPEVMATAKSYIDNVYQPMTDAAIKAGLDLPGMNAKDFTALMARVYDVSFMATGKGQRLAKQKFVDWLASERARAQGDPSKLMEFEANVKSSEAELERLKSDQPQGVSFQTSRASYQVHESGATTRTQGVVQPRSEATFYVTPEDAARIKPAGTGGGDEFRFFVNDGGEGSLLRRAKSGKSWSSAGNLNLETAPRVGLIPIEVRNADRELTGGTGYRNFHSGSEITQVSEHPGGIAGHNKAVGETRAKLADAAKYEQDTLANRGGLLGDEEVARARAARAEAEAAHAKTQAARAVARGAVTRAEEKLARYTTAATQERNLGLLDDGEINDLSSEIYDHIMTSPLGNMMEPIKLENQKGLFKDKGFILNIPDKNVREITVMDAERLARMHVSRMAPEIEIKRAFPNDTSDLRDLREDINDDYNRQIDRVNKSNELTDAQKDAETKRLTDEKRNAPRDLSDILARLRGTFALPQDPSGLWTKVGRTFGTWNYLRMGGGFSIQSMSDAGSVVAIHGFNRISRDYFGAMAKNAKLVKMSAKEAEIAGVATDVVLGSRMNTVTGMFDDSGHMGPIERGLQAVGRKYGLFNVLSYQTDAIKKIAAVVGQTRTLEACEALANGTLKVGDEELTRLAELNIDRNMAERITAEFNRPGVGQTDGPARWANTSAWEDKEARDAFRAAMASEVDKAVVTPGLDRPSWMLTGFGKAVGQFKGFTLVTTGRVLAAGLQRRDVAVFQGFATMVGLGFLSTICKLSLAGKLQDAPDDPLWWIAQSVDTSGVTGWLSEANMMAEKSLGLGVLGMLGVEQPQRYTAMGVDDLVGGPVYSLVEDLLKTAQDVTGSSKAAIAEEEGYTDINRRNAVNRTTMARVRRLMPFQNLVYMRWLFDMVEQGAGDAMGLPPARVRHRKPGQ